VTLSLDASTYDNLARSGQTLKCSSEIAGNEQKMMNTGRAGERKGCDDQTCMIGDIHTHRHTDSQK
jgi:hypothetical protein